MTKLEIEKMDDDDYDETDDDDLDDEAEGCGSRVPGQCDLIGTEWCDWNCPLHDEVFKSRLRALKAAAK